MVNINADEAGATDASRTQGNEGTGGYRSIAYRRAFGGWPPRRGVFKPMPFETVIA